MHRRELVFPGAEAQHADGVGAVGEHAAVLPRVLGHLTDQPVGALGRHLGGHVAVERAGGAALLHVTCRRQGLGVTGTDGVRSRDLSRPRMRKRTFLFSCVS